MERTRINPVYRALNKPLTILGCERSLFFLALIAGTLAFQLLQTVVGAVLLFVVLLIAGQRATKADPRFVKVMRRSSTLRRVYDGGKYHGGPSIRVLRRDGHETALGVAHA